MMDPAGTENQYSASTANPDRKRLSKRQKSNENLLPVRTVQAGPKPDLIMYDARKSIASETFSHWLFSYAC